MQLLGFTLATKQPSMTAAALAHSLDESDRRQDAAHLEGLVTMIARIVRSQLAAAMGNIGMVIPTALGVHFLWTTFGSGKPFLSVKDANYVLHSLDARSGMTWWFAGLTGVFLWFSSIGAGWLENWAVYRRLPEAIAEHRWGKIFGRRTMQAISRWFARNISGFGGNTTLGFLLGMAPVAKKFTGLGIGVLHVTLSTGSLVLAACTLGPDVLATPQFRYACLGILVIGALNFGVSFWLALAVALRARAVGYATRFRLLWGVIKRLVRAPWEFFYPPRF
jgi:site-specific recombinase